MVGETPVPDDATDTCMNCNATLDGPFCAQCGQKDLGSRLSLRELIWSWFSEVFEVEGKLPNTAWSLVVAPGRYLGDYLDGRRAAYSSPLRFYLLGTFLALLAAGFAGERAVTHLAATNGIALSWEDNNLNFTFGTRDPFDFQPAVAVNTDTPDPPTCDPPPLDWALDQLHQPRSLQSHLVHRPTDFGERFRTLAILLDRHTEAEFTILILKSGLDWLPLTLALLLGVVAVVLKLLFWRHVVTVHLLTAITLQAIGVWAFTILVLMPWISVALVLGLWVFAHVVAGLKAAYAIGWPRAVVSASCLLLVWSLGAMLAWILAVLLGIQDLSNVAA